MYTEAGIDSAQIPEVYPVYMGKKWQYWTRDDFRQRKPLPSGGGRTVEGLFKWQIDFWGF
jgi:hypothetical protein